MRLVALGCGSDKELRGTGYTAHSSGRADWTDGHRASVEA